MNSLSIDDLFAAERRIKGHVRTTPLLNNPILDQKFGKRIFVKAECLQITGSFKIRGAWSAISHLDGAAQKQGIIAYSSGNHAQGIAYAGRMHQIPTVIIMPKDAPKSKRENTKAYGAELILYDRANGEKREGVAEAVMKERGALNLIPPYDHLDVIAGQGTTGIEIAKQAGDFGIPEAEVIVCCGGGGLTAGIALALAHLAPDLTVRPAEPENFDDVSRSLASGEIQTNGETQSSICDAILTPSLGEKTWPLLKAHCDRGHVVSDEACLKAMALAYEHFKIILEPGGAAALAAALFHKTATNVIAVASGGNVDKDIFQKALRSFDN